MEEVGVSEQLDENWIWGGFFQFKPSRPLLTSSQICPTRLLHWNLIKSVRAVPRKSEFKSSLSQPRISNLFVEQLVLVAQCRFFQRLPLWTSGWWIKPVLKCTFIADPPSRSSRSIPWPIHVAKLVDGIALRPLSDLGPDSWFFDSGPATRAVKGSNHVDSLIHLLFQRFPWFPHLHFRPLP